MRHGEGRKYVYLLRIVPIEYMKSIKYTKELLHYKIKVDNSLAE